MTFSFRGDCTHGDIIRSISASFEVAMNLVAVKEATRRNDCAFEEVC